MTFVILKLFLVALQLNGLVASSTRNRKLHRFPEEFKPVDLFDGIARAFRILEDNKRLTFRAKVLFRDDVNDRTKLRKYRSQGLRQGFQLDALFEVLNVNTTTS